jgi:GTP-binding protein YchF
VLRCFEDDDITHVSGRIDPLSDFEVVETELMLADMDSLEKRRLNVEKKAKGGDKEAIQTLELLKLALEQLNAGKPARRAKISAEDQKAWKMLQLLTSKPVFYICNVDENSAGTGNSFSDAVVAHAKAEGSAAVVISAKIESETAVLSDDEQKEFLESLGLEEPGLNRVIRAGYELLGLQTYFTVGPKEARAWTIKKGTTAPQAAGVIHGDFEKGFIKAETIAYDDYVKFKGESGAKEAGKARQEGKEYIVQDGDVMHFRFNV